LGKPINSDNPRETQTELNHGNHITKRNDLTSLNNSTKNAESNKIPHNGFAKLTLLRLKHQA